MMTPVSAARFNSAPDDRTDKLLTQSEQFLWLATGIGAFKTRSERFEDAALLPGHSLWSVACVLMTSVLPPAICGLRPESLSVPTGGWFLRARARPDRGRGAGCRNAILKLPAAAEVDA
jgi:hypothetical protein